MLLSPGHSPRHLSTPSPPLPFPPIQTLTLILPLFLRQLPISPPVSAARSPNVLDEDTYVAAIEKIIERDFFPDIPKLRDRLDWLQAVRTHDPVLIRDAQLKIIERRRLRKSGDSAADSSLRSTTATPGSSFLRNTSVTPAFYNEKKVVLVSDELEGNGDGGEEQVDVSLSLDDFFKKYTSEDNESFSRIIEKVNRKRKEKYGYLLECGSSDENSGNNLIENGNKREKTATDGYGTSDQPVSTLEGWNYTPKNLLMYHPADRGEAPLTEEERALRLKAMTKEIRRSNTRFHGKTMDINELKDDDTVAVLYSPVAGATPIPMSSRDSDKMKKYDLEDLRKTRIGSTWSLRRRQTMDIVFGDGPQFKIPMPPSRDVRAHTLSREAARKLRERSKMFQKPPLPSPVRGGSASPNTRRLSPAAQKFMRNAIAKSSQTIDESLRASYRSGSPGLNTPKSGRSMSRLGRDGSMGSRSPSIREGSNPPW
ncbi:hypothetical protein DH2020_026954 [Rehmannia glutinosa]|uniref:DGCR14-like protein n=1 Tax=Rehmannia glutinosa TaxID=99300 RepID=A0ABR0VVG5_REHGL